MCTIVSYFGTYQAIKRLVKLHEDPGQDINILLQAVIHVLNIHFYYIKTIYGDIIKCVHRIFNTDVFLEEENVYSNV